MTVDLEPFRPIFVTGFLSSNTRDVPHKYSVDCQKKHGKGGQSALQIALCMEKCHNYMRKTADFKTELSQSDMFDPCWSSLPMNTDGDVGTFDDFSDDV